MFKKKCSNKVPLTTCKENSCPTYDNLHTMVAERCLFLAEPFLLLPQTSGVAQTTCCCSHSNPKCMTSSRHTTYLIKRQCQTKTMHGVTMYDCHSNSSAHAYKLRGALFLCSPHPAMFQSLKAQTQNPELAHLGCKRAVLKCM